MHPSVLHLDVLVTIFEQLAAIPFVPAREKRIQNVTRSSFAFPWFDYASIGSAALTCRWWRNAVLSTPACWTTITLKLETDDGHGEKYSTDSVRWAILDHMRLRLDRSRATSLKVIILNEESSDISTVLERKDFVDLFSRCIERAEDLHVRSFDFRLGTWVKNNLARIPRLQRLSLWQLSPYDSKNIWPSLNRYHTHPKPLSNLPTFPNGAPVLREYRTRGWKEADEDVGSGKLPMIETLCLDKANLAMTVQDWNHLANTFSGVTRLFLFTSGHYPGVTSFKLPLTFPNLVHLEVEAGWDLILRDPVRNLRPPFIKTPKLNTVRVVILSYRKELIPGGMLVEALSTSQDTTKKLIIDGFAWKLKDASHMRLLKYLSTFEFVTSLEFRRCRFRYSRSWIVAWGLGVTGVDDVVAETAEDLSVKAGDETLRRLLAKNVLRHNGEGQVEPFMPSLQEVTFENCLFIDGAGAASFVAALARSQARREQRGSGIRRIAIVDMVDDATTEFVAGLQGHPSFAGVEIVVASSKMA